MVKDFSTDIEGAVRLLARYFVPGQHKKPVLAHSVRVGMWLLERGYPREVVLAGLLHDLLEDTNAPEAEIAAFGKKVLAIVKANTKDPTIFNADERRRELIARTVAAGQDALIVKCADILDNYRYYASCRDEAGINYCTQNAGYIKESLRDDYEDPAIKAMIEIAR